MNNSEPKVKTNLLVEMAKRKAAAKASGNRLHVLGKDLSVQFSKDAYTPSPKKRGGRNGSGKP